MALWTGQTISLMGSQVTSLAIPLLALSRFDVSAFQVSLLAAIGYSPTLLFALHAGVRAEHGSRRGTMLWTNVVRMVLVGSIPVANAFGCLYLIQLYFVIFISAISAVYFDASYQSYTPTVLHGKQLIEGNVKLGLSSSLANVSGPAAGGVLVGILGAANAIAADAVSFLVSVVSLILIRSREHSLKYRQVATRQDIIDGLRYVYRNRAIRDVVASGSLASSALAASNALWLAYVYRDLHWSAHAAGLTLGIGSVGAVVGSLIAQPLIDRVGLGKAMIVGAATLPLEVVPTCLVRPGLAGQLIVAGGFFVLLAGSIVLGVSSRSFRQLVCEPAYLGRMNGSSRWIMWGPKPFVAVLAGVAAEEVGLLPVLVATGAVLVGPVCWLLASKPQSVADALIG